jgi:hypothetical protein
MISLFILLLLSCLPSTAMMTFDNHASAIVTIALVVENEKLKRWSDFQ